jgi:probable F420-dependent oxidoreductase
MRAYLDAMDAAPFQGVRPSVTPRRVLAALGPAMLKLAAEKTWGAHPYFAPVAHTKFARQTLGRGPLLAVEQAAVLETNPVTARAIARLHTTYYLALPNYANNLRRLGYRDDDIKEGGSDRLVDDLVAWGDVPAITKRVQQHLDSGADHVCIQVLTQERDEIPMAAWRSLASVLLS